MKQAEARKWADEKRTNSQDENASFRLEEKPSGGQVALHYATESVIPTALSAENASGTLPDAFFRMIRIFCILTPPPENYHDKVKQK
ncbi:hypothetical protein [Cohnella hashimotonis]|uniref:Uncharacterized protein n=1 Tax=Cohnella hashimotonis TaxID=2826895 RepID=A0ABT6T9J7_9BACL|nr:hypothetical protein [Cohnella hashimotonis]MDI4643485.1 hypothetical protein [Cohnella hashimotonis]